MTGARIRGCLWIALALAAHAIGYHFGFLSGLDAVAVHNSRHKSVVEFAAQFLKRVPDPAHSNDQLIEFAPSTYPSH